MPSPRTPYVLKSPVFSVSHDLQGVLCTSFYRGRTEKDNAILSKGDSIFEFSDFDKVRKKSLFNQKSLRHGHWPTLRHKRVKSLETDYTHVFRSISFFWLLYLWKSFHLKKNRHHKCLCHSDMHLFNSHLAKHNHFCFLHWSMSVHTWYCSMYILLDSTFFRPWKTWDQFLQMLVAHTKKVCGWMKYSIFSKPAIYLYAYTW